MLRRHHDSYLYAELAELTAEPGPRAALLCRAIQSQRQEKFCAAYEVQRCLAVREGEGLRPGRELWQLRQQLADARPVGDADQRDFYRRMVEKYPI